VVVDSMRDWIGRRVLLRLRRRLPRAGVKATCSLLLYNYRNSEGTPRSDGHDHGEGALSTTHSRIVSLVTDRSLFHHQLCMRLYIGT
jgi:hypothetical protein